MNSNGSTPRGSVRSISTSPPASSVHSLEGSGGGTVVAVTAEEGGGGSGGEAVLAFSSGGRVGEWDRGCGHLPGVRGGGRGAGIRRARAAGRTPAG